MLSWRGLGRAKEGRLPSARVSLRYEALPLRLLFVPPDRIFGVCPTPCGIFFSGVAVGRRQSFFAPGANCDCTSYPSNSRNNEQAWEASIAALENALREVVNIGVKAASSAGIVLPRQPPRSAPLPSAKSGARAKHVVGGGGVADGVKVAAGSMPPSVNTQRSGKTGASGGRVAGVRGGGKGKGERKGESGLSAVVIAAAAEDVAVQAACAVLTTRLAWGEVSLGRAGGCFRYPYLFCQ